MKLMLPAILLVSCVSLAAQTAATQQSTDPAAATNNATTSAPQATPAPANPATTDASKPSAAATSVDQPTIPTVKTFPQNDPQEVDPRIATKPLPKKKVTLIGGTVREIDPIRNRMVVQVYGGKPLKLVFDSRTKVQRNGADISYMNIRKGDRVYLDTQQFGDRIFARQIQVVTNTGTADVSGQVVAFDPKTRRLELRDSLSPRAYTFALDQDAAITADGKAATDALLQPGALVSGHFSGGADKSSIRDLNVLASPGEEFTLYGKVNHVDLRSGMLAIQNKTDDKAYEVKFDPSQFQTSQLMRGSEVSVTAKFDGQDYVAQALNVVAGPNAAQDQTTVDSDEGTEAPPKDQDKKEKKDDKSNDSSPDQNPK